MAIYGQVSTIDQDNSLEIQRERIEAESKALAKSQNKYTGGAFPFGFDVIENKGKKFLKKTQSKQKS